MRAHAAPVADCWSPPAPQWSSWSPRWASDSGPVATASPRRPRRIWSRRRRPRRSRPPPSTDHAGAAPLAPRQQLRLRHRPGSDRAASGGVRSAGRLRLEPDRAAVHITAGTDPGEVPLGRRADKGRVRPSEYQLRLPSGSPEPPAGLPTADVHDMHVDVRKLAYSTWTDVPEGAAPVTYDSPTVHAWQTPSGASRCFPIRSIGADVRAYAADGRLLAEHVIEAPEFPSAGYVGPNPAWYDLKATLRFCREAPLDQVDFVIGGNRGRFRMFDPTGGIADVDRREFCSRERGAATGTPERHPAQSRRRRRRDPDPLLPVGRSQRARRRGESKRAARRGAARHQRRPTRRGDSRSARPGRRHRSRSRPARSEADRQFAVAGGANSVGWVPSDDHVAAARAVYDAAVDRYVEFVGTEISAATRRRSIVRCSPRSSTSWQTEPRSASPMSDADRAAWRPFLRRVASTSSGWTCRPRWSLPRDVAHPDISFEEGHLDDLPIDEGSLAGVVCWYSIIYTPPECLGDAFSELERVLTPRGIPVGGLPSRQW